MRCTGITDFKEQRLPAEFVVSSGQRIINKKAEKKHKKNVFLVCSESQVTKGEMDWLINYESTLWTWKDLSVNSSIQISVKVPRLVVVSVNL